MAINQNHDYKQIYDQTYELIKRAVGDGAANGGRDGLVKALSNLEIDGKQVDINTKSFQKALDDALQDAFSKVRARGFRVANIDFADFLSLDAKTLQKEINKALKDIEINPSIKTNKRLYGLASLSVAKGFQLKDANGAKIDTEYVKSLQEFAGVTNAQADLIQKKFADVVKSIDLSSLVEELIIAANQVEKTTTKIEESAKRVKKAKEDIRKQDAAPKKQQKEPTSKSEPIVNKGIEQTEKAAQDAIDNVRQLQLALRDVLGFEYAIDSKSNPLTPLILQVQDGTETLENALSKVSNITKFKELTDSLALPKSAMDNGGLVAFNVALEDIANNSLDAQAAFEKFVGELRQGSKLVGTEGRTNVTAQNNVDELTKEYQRLKDVIDSVAESSNQFEKNVGAEAQKSLERVEGLLRKKTMVFDAADQKWVKPKSQDSERKYFDDPEMNKALASMFGAKPEKFTADNVANVKAETEAHAKNVAEIQKEVQVKKESDKISESSKAVTETRAEEQAHKDNVAAIREEKQAKQTQTKSDEKSQLQQQLDMLRKIRDEKKAAYEEEKANLDALQAKSDVYMRQDQSRFAYDGFKSAYQNAQQENFDHIKNKQGEMVSASHTDALYFQAKEHAKRYATSQDERALGKAAGYFKQYVDSLQNAEKEMKRVVIADNDMTDKLLSDAAKLQDTKSTGVDMADWRKTNEQIYQASQNVDNLKKDYDEANEAFKHFKQNMDAPRKPAVTEEDLARQQKLNELRAASERRGEKRSGEEEADSQQKLNEELDKTIEKKKEEQSISDSGEAVANAEKEAEAEGEVAAQIEKKIKVKKEAKSVSDASDDVANTEKEAAAVTETAQAYEKKAEAVKEANAVTVTQVIKSEDLSPVLMQLTNIIGLLERKNNLFIREGSIVAEQAAKEVNSLKEVAEVVESIVKNLQEASSKKVSISFKGLESLNSLVGKDLTGIVSALQSLANVGEVNMSVKTNGIKGLEALTKLDIDKLGERLKAAHGHIVGFATSLNEIKVDDGSLFNSLNNLLKDGEKLKNLATALKASKKQIDNVTEAISKPKEQSKTKVDLSEWKELNKVVKEYYELKNTDSDKLTQSEQGRLTEIESLWAKVRGEVEKTTAALKEQGQSTKLIEDVTRAYTAGFAEWQKQQTLSDLNSDRSDLTKLSDRFSKRLNDYPSKYIEEAATQVQSLQAMVAALNSKPIDVVTDKEISDAQKLAEEIQQGFNSADWKVANQTKVSNLQNEISMYMKNFSGLSKDTTDQLDALIERLNHVGSGADLSKVVQEFNSIKIAARKAGEEGTSFFSKMGKQIEHLNAQAFAMYLSWQDIIRYIRQAAGAVIELDSALTELRKVSDASTERLQQSFETSAKTAKELGSTVDSVINQTADWSRLGYSVDDAEKLARVTTLFQTVGDNMTTDSASEAMISTLKAYEMGVDEAESVVDRYNEIANNFSIDTQG